MKLCIKKPKQQAARGTVGMKMGIRNKPGENMCFARKTRILLPSRLLLSALDSHQILLLRSRA